MPKLAPNKKPKQITSFRLAEEILVRLDILAEENFVSRTAMLQQLVMKEYINEYGTKKIPNQ